jgi:hypothetical protein
LKKVTVEFCKPSIIVLCLAGSIRNAAGYVWGYNNNNYYKQLGQTPDQISAYLGVIPLVFGIVGSFVGGFVSDRVAKKAKPWYFFVSSTNCKFFVQPELSCQHSLSKGSASGFLFYRKLSPRRSCSAFCSSIRPTRTTS